MKDLKPRYDTTKKAIGSFTIAVEKLKGADVLPEEEYRTLRDSAIKRFEISVDTLWKYLKIYLEVQKGVIHNSPKPVFRECLRTGILSDKNTQVALEMVDARNMTSHIYKEEIAEQISNNFPLYATLMEKIISTTIPQ
ncbi:TPA: nucleotidyltransferase [Candidatus Dependentiae bacterium]|nr:MAG: Nucleotidyltransferase substrate binding protein, HI0074 family [candidate division TM6 bacterium GW2011_GWF2_36_131]KKQ03267.1 MAG: Nucleotidyltransferase substrate binding protein, HI0074 family [candidate division TM6 bacterium GW2011_GWE2_36_25]KKQ19189.1 MAG: Nucleotidyltransferase substrate binding protein, HI0074 family [candidate division TM6 bacterium GW2011_GWA2_36_9]HBR70305.1 nucleotidyltransferase [Candidatus Dependentiae bacterium]HCU00850.1 nucleotidyltransferase [Candida